MQQFKLAIGKIIRFGNWLGHAGIEFFNFVVAITRTVQGVVTYMSPVEAFATVINFFDWQKVCLIA